MRGRARSPEWCDRFRRDWNAGVSTDGLRERYGVRQPSLVASRLRRRGLALIERAARTRFTSATVSA